MAKKHHTRAPRKQKYVEIDGHKLSPAQHRHYEAELAASTNQQPYEAHRRALDNTLAGFRPSRWVKEELRQVYRFGLSASLALASMADYPWFNGGPIREAGCDCLHKLEYELYGASVRLSRMREALLAEDSEKLQDWERRAVELDAALAVDRSRRISTAVARVGTSKEVQS